MWLSPDSFLAHLCSRRQDSEWFFMAGKAWMEGMVPYVDFADSKGPLLWLIYGIGYLLSPTSYIGVFWLSVVAYTVAFSYIWRAVRLFVEKREALLVLVLIPFVLFFRIYHNEVRAEDFCMPCMCAGLYFTLRSMSSPSGSSVRRPAFGLGVAMACCLLIKWSIFVMMGGMALIVLWISFSRKRMDALVGGLLGVATIMLPFSAYFICEGNFMAMVREYFVNTYLITGQETDNWHVLIRLLLVDRFYLYTMVELTVIIVGLVLFCRHFRFSYLLLLAFLPFWIVLVFKSTLPHYFCITMPFYMFLFMYMVHCCRNFVRRMNRLPYAFVAVFLLLAGVVFNVHSENLVFFHSTEQETWDDIQSFMAKRQYPKIMFCNIVYSFGVVSRALPACKYWALQSGASEEMKEERYRAIRKRIPDYIILNPHPSIASHQPCFIPLLRRSGYRECYSKVEKKGGLAKKVLIVYCKSE